MGTVTMPEPQLRVLGKLYTYEQAARILGLRAQTLRLWASQGRLSVVRLGRAVRISESALHHLIAVGYDPANE